MTFGRENEFLHQQNNSHATLLNTKNNYSHY